MSRILYSKTLWACIFPDESGLSLMTYVTYKWTHRKRPTLIVGRNENTAAILIGDAPRVLRGKLEPNIRKEIYEWIVLNKKDLLEYWQEGKSIAKLKKYLINMKQVIKREPTKEDLQFIDAVSFDELLSVEDEVELVKKIRQGDGDVETAKEKLMRANQRFVRTVAQRYVSEKHSLEELMAEGNLGLEHAIYKYDETRGFKFNVYAVWWIRQSIQQYIVLQAKATDELNGLSKRELDILRMYFGFGCEKATIEEIQAKYNLTTQRAMFIKDKALRKLFKSKEKLSTVRAALLGEADNEENKD